MALDTEKETAPITPRKLLVIVIEIILVALIALTAVSLVQMYWIAPIAIAGTSMEDTVYDKDQVYINKAYRSLSRGDVVVTYVPTHFGNYDASGYSVDWWEYTDINDDTQRCPASRTKTFDDFLSFIPFMGALTTSDETGAEGADYYLIIKRIVGIPGDSIEIADGVLYVNGQREERAGLAHYTNDYARHTLGEDEYFVLGDNRAVSHDSHAYGPIKGSWVYGKVMWAFVKGKLIKM